MCPSFVPPGVPSYFIRDVDMPSAVNALLETNRSRYAPPNRPTTGKPFILRHADFESRTVPSIIRRGTLMERFIPLRSFSPFHQIDRSAGSVLYIKRLAAICSPGIFVPSQSTVVRPAEPVAYIMSRPVYDRLGRFNSRDSKIRHFVALFTIRKPNTRSNTFEIAVIAVTVGIIIFSTAVTRLSELTTTGVSGE